jgi:hypothetical protein
VLRESAFRDVEQLTFLDRGTTTPELLLHRALSMSATSESRLGAGVETMAGELRAVLAPFAAAARWRRSSSGPCSSPAAQRSG